MVRCPDDLRLQSFLGGHLSEPDMGCVADHLTECERCVQTLDGLQVRDPLLDTVHTLKDQEWLGPQPREVEALVQRVCGVLLSQCDNTAPPDATPQEKIEDRGSRIEDGSEAREPQGAIPVPQPNSPTVPGYEVLGLLGRGGMGAVYKARHKALGKVMALKLLPPGERLAPQTIARFREEMQAVGRLNHAHIVQAHDAGEADGVPYLAMEYLEGIDLGELLRQHGPLFVADACAMARQTALGLQHAHEHGLVHRDLKPSNLLLTTAGVVKILDFGLARLRESFARPKSLTLTWPTMGTPDFMAPEQWLNAQDVSVRTDLYSLGCTLYHLLVGRPPFDGADLLAKRKGHLLQAPTPLRECRPDVPLALARLVEQLLAKDPALRPPTPAAVAAALRPFTAGSALVRLLELDSGADAVRVVAARPPTARLHRPRRPPVSRFLVCAAVLLFGLGLLAASVIYVATDRGTLVVKTADPNVEVIVKKNGQVVQILDKQSGKEITLWSGTYDLELQNGQPGLKLRTDRFVLTRGDEKIVEVFLEAKPGATATPPPEPAKGWMAKAPLPIPPGICTMVAMNGRLYVVGGSKGSGPDNSYALASLQTYDPKTNQWDDALAPLPRTDGGDAGRYGGSVGVIDGQLYLAGGWRLTPPLPTSTLLIYDPAKDVWSQGQRLPMLSTDSVGGVIDKKFYVYTTSDGYANNFQRNTYLHQYDPATNEWTNLSPPSYLHNRAGGGVIGGKLYLVGGQDGKGVCLGEVEVYDPVAKKWSPRAPLPQPRAGLTCAVVNRKLYAVGGQDQKGVNLKTVEVYDPAANRWTAAQSLQTARSVPGVATIGHTLYAVGGLNEKGPLATVEALTVSDR